MVAIDGTSGSGKSSTSRGVAARLGLRYLDTGAMFRAVTWWMLDHGIDVEDAASVAARAERRALEEGGSDLTATQESLLNRDRIDSGRATAPLVMADGAVHLDTTPFTLDEVIDQVVELVALAEEHA